MAKSEKCGRSYELVALQEANEKTKGDFTEEPLTTSGKQLSKQRKLWKTATVYYCYFVHGIGNALLGATLVDLQLLLHCSTQTISTVFLWRNAGLVLGCLIAGRICDKINQHVLHGVSLVLMSIILSCAPLCPSFTSFCTVMVVCSISNGVLFVGTSAFLIDLWRDKCAPYLQAVFVFSMIGSALCPQIVKPFLGDPYFYHNSDGNETIKPSTANVSLSNETLPNSAEKYETKIQFAYLICGGMFLSGALMHGLNLCYSGCTLEHIDDAPRGATSSSEQAGTRQSNKIFCISVVSILCMMAFLFGGVEDLFGGYLITFLVRELEWPIKTASDLASLYWASQALIRLVTALTLSRWASPNVLVGIFVTCAITLLTFMTFTLSLTPVVMWIGTIGVGLSLGSLFATIITIGKTFIKSSGVLSSMNLISLFMGKILTAPLIGYLFENVSYMWFIYLALIYCSVMVLNYVLINICRCVENHLQNHKEKDTEKEIHL